MRSFPQLSGACDLPFLKERGGYCVCEDHIAVPAVWSKALRRLKVLQNCERACYASPLSAAVTIPNRGGCPEGAVMYHAHRRMSARVIFSLSRLRVM